MKDIENFPDWLNESDVLDVRVHSLAAVDWYIRCYKHLFGGEQCLYAPKTGLQLFHWQVSLVSIIDTESFQSDHDCYEWLSHEVSADERLCVLKDAVTRSYEVEQSSTTSYVGACRLHTNWSLSCDVTLHSSPLLKDYCYWIQNSSKNKFFKLLLWKQVLELLQINAHFPDNFEAMW